jgi:hypothetical protein
MPADAMPDGGILTRLASTSATIRDTPDLGAGRYSASS